MKLLLYNTANGQEMTELNSPSHLQNMDQEKVTVRSFFQDMKGIIALKLAISNPYSS